MKVLMLGWEFPPFITGGLGTACHGLTRALDERGVAVTFVLPRPVGSEADHVDLVSPGGGEGEKAEPPPAGSGRAGRPPAFAHARFVPVKAGFVSPYARPAEEASAGTGTVPRRVGSGAAAPAEGPGDLDPGDLDPGDVGLPPIRGSAEYGGDLISQVHAYAEFCVEALADETFDVIHAHDWMTYPAGLWLARATGRPLVVHVHSTEFDRSGEHVHQRIYDIERRGMHGALRVICVSELTRNIVVHRYGVPKHCAEVVYNGVDIDTTKAGVTGIRRRDKIVLYFGRITFQKGPEYFLRAAQRVCTHMDDVKFVVAGSGDMAEWMITRASEMGIGHKVLFTGFLRGDDIPRVFDLADLYVMPSVSEPFGIAPLEAMSHDVPVLISRSSGVSEVLTHALKVDFWDVDDMANKIIAVLRHPPLGQTLRQHGRMEVRQLTWAGAAQRCEDIYRAVVGELSHPHVTST
jgi:glycosyltransferase involved in cell wall biosynthesis